MTKSTPQSLKVAVLAGGLSHERDVSIRSGRRVADALRSTGVQVQVFDVDASLIPALQDYAPDLVWPLLHGSTGEDGSLRDVLELTGLPYVGTNPRASRIAWGKPLAKTVVSGAGIATPRFVTLAQSLFSELGAMTLISAIADQFGFPLFVKPARGGSALGVSKVKTVEELPKALVTAFSYDENAIIECAVSGTEVAVSIIEQNGEARTLPGVEVRTEGDYDYDARYNPGRTEYFTPARLSAEETAAVNEAALAVHRVLRLRHLSRIDLILDDDGVPNLIDVNVAPGMTETSLLPQAAEAAGYDLGELYLQVVHEALSHQ